MLFKKDKTMNIISNITNFPVDLSQRLFLIHNYSHNYDSLMPKSKNAITFNNPIFFLEAENTENFRFQYSIIPFFIIDGEIVLDTQYHPLKAINSSPNNDLANNHDLIYSMIENALKGKSLTQEQNNIVTYNFSCIEDEQTLTNLLDGMIISDLNQVNYVTYYIKGIQNYLDKKTLDLMLNFNSMFFTYRQQEKENVPFEDRLTFKQSYRANFTFFSRMILEKMNIVSFNQLTPDDEHHQGSDSAIVLDILKHFQHNDFSLEYFYQVKDNLKKAISPIFLSIVIEQFYKFGSNEIVSDEDLALRLSSNSIEKYNNFLRSHPVPAEENFGNTKYDFYLNNTTNDELIEYFLKLYRETELKQLENI